MTVSFNPSPPLSVSPYRLLARLVVRHDDPTAQYAPELLPDAPQTRALVSPSNIFILLDNPTAVWNALVADPAVSELLTAHGRAYFVIGVRATNPGGADPGTGSITELEYVEVARTADGIAFDYEQPAAAGCTCGQDATRGAARLVRMAAPNVAGAVAERAAQAGGVAALAWAGFTKGGTWSPSTQGALASAAKKSWLSSVQSVGPSGIVLWLFRVIASLVASAAVAYAMSRKKERLCEYCRRQRHGE